MFQIPQMFLPKMFQIPQMFLPKIFQIPQMFLPKIFQIPQMFDQNREKIYRWAMHPPCHQEGII